MARDVKETIDLPAGVVELSQDIHDNPERTDRWIVDCHICFPDEAGARQFLELIQEQIKPLPSHFRSDVRIDLRATTS